jgi:hypothetical protein
MINRMISEVISRWRSSLGFVWLASSACHPTTTATPLTTPGIVMRPALGASADQPADERVVVDVPMRYPNDSTYARIPVQIGAHDSLWFLVDFGAAQTVIWPRTQERVGSAVQITGPGSMMGLNGVVKGNRGLVDSLRSGTLVKAGFPVMILDIPTMLRWSAMPQHAPEPDGLLGLNMFQDDEGNWLYDIELDFPARRFRLYDYTTHPIDSVHAIKKPTWAGVRGLACVPQLMWLNKGMLFTQLVIDGQSFPAIFDTGAPRSTIPRDVAAVVGLTPNSPGVVLKDSAGGAGSERIARYRASEVSLSVGGVALRPGAVDFREKDELGRLGLNAVSDRVVFVAASTGELCFGPRQ